MLVERDGQRDVVKILDFGIAKVTAAAVRAARRSRRPASSSARPSTCRPSRRWARRSTRAPTSTPPGVILYEMLAGRRPFESEDKVKIISMHLAHAPPRIRDVGPIGRRSGCRWSRRCCRRSRSRASNRFATATAFMQALEDAEAPAEATARCEIGADRAPPAPARLGRGPPPAGRRARRSAGGRAGAARRCWCGGIVRVTAGGTPRRWSRRRPSRRPRRPTWPTASRRSKPGWRTATCRRRAARLEQALSERPKDGRVRYMLGRVAYADDSAARRRSAHYREAITLDAGFRGDPVLLGARRHAAWRAEEDADGALDLVDRKHRRPRRRSAREGRQRRHRPDAPAARRRRAGRHRPGQARRPGLAGDARAQEGARAARSGRCWSRSCASLGDARALPALRALRGRSLGPLRFGGADTRCMKKELPEAIKALEKKGGAPERRARAADGEPADDGPSAPLRPARTCSPAWCWCSRCSSSTRSASCSRCRC